MGKIRRTMLILLTDLFFFYMSDVENYSKIFHCKAAVTHAVAGLGAAR